MKKAFVLLDKDGDKLISRQDLLDAMTDAGVAFGKNTLEIFQELDRDGDGCITFDEFAVFWETHVKEDTVKDNTCEKRIPERAYSTLLPNAVVGMQSDFHGDEMPQGKDCNDEVLKRMLGNHLATAISRRNRLRPFRLKELLPEP